MEPRLNLKSLSQLMRTPGPLPYILVGAAAMEAISLTQQLVVNLHAKSPAAAPVL